MYDVKKKTKHPPAIELTVLSQLCEDNDLSLEMSTAVSPDLAAGAKLVILHNNVTKHL